MDNRPMIERADDVASVNNTLLSAFMADPVLRWLYDTPDRYFRDFPRFIAALHGPTYQHDMTWRVDDHAGVALWLPPGVEPDTDEILATLDATTPPPKLDEMLQIAEQMGEAHPTYAHWYLAWLGVDMCRQSQGLGALLMKHALRIVDESGLPAYLESPSARNVPFYERHGFEIVGQTRTATAPPVFFMLRPGRA
jgi:GNAT superfamily N-acetyltransferase